MIRTVNRNILVNHPQRKGYELFQSVIWESRVFSSPDRRAIFVPADPKMGEEYPVVTLITMMRPYDFVGLKVWFTPEAAKQYRENRRP